ncbi:hypothetical protein DLM75_22935 [Leptospira stimsonii]|uniref:Uncharacterized protein n=1 Tax=Leptospira stimsonii TaxID=2202203 RepID=A0A396YSK5_9LEPT|nr:hypothetical protein DLM75_22935 [Leptospira stimsonii]
MKSKEKDSFLIQPPKRKNSGQIQLNFQFQKSNLLILAILAKNLRRILFYRDGFSSNPTPQHYIISSLLPYYNVRRIFKNTG